MSYTSIEKLLTSLKFAIFLILTMALTLSIGTVIESIHGTDYANRLIYKSIFFMLLQFLMFLSIFLATLVRLPIKKRLRGFYALHLGLLLLFSGSFITYKNGIDGQMILTPNDPTRTILLPEDMIKVTNHLQNQVHTLELPSTHKEIKLDHQLEDLHFDTFLPFSENELNWKKVETGPESAQYFLKNAFLSQDIVLSLNPRSLEFTNMKQLGPLTAHLIPKELGDCIGKNELILWNQQEHKCYLPKELESLESFTESKKKFLVFKKDDQIFSFFPDSTPYAFNEKLDPIPNAAWRIFNIELFQKNPQLLLFGDKLAYFEEEWKIHTLKDWIELPWMGFEIKQVKWAQDEYPLNIPYFAKPIQENGKTIVGDQRAIHFTMGKYSYWVTNTHPIEIRLGEQKWTIELIKKSISLPYKLNLDTFKLLTDPGSNNPASYESYVTLFNTHGPSEHKIFMNNPLKHEGMTFYQSSYFPLESNEGYGSVLSVNWDPGRMIKYLGALLLVFGSFFHFYIQKRVNL